MSIKNNLKEVKEQLPDAVQLIAVSKKHKEEEILEAYEAGQRIFGENKVQELIGKQPHLPEDIQWHFIGHLQSNKVKHIAPFVSFIHAVHKFKLLKEINKQAKKNDRVINCLLQFHIADEESKFGMTEEQAENLLNMPQYKELKNVTIVGVMGMATFTEDTEQVKNEFGKLKHIFQNIKTKYFADQPEFKELSMGMSNDYKIAMEQGSTMVRIGTAIFGKRNI